MSLINEALKRTRDASANAGVSQPAAASYRVQSDFELSGTKGNFLITILVSGAVLVAVIALGSRIAKHVQSVKEGFASNTETSATDTSVVETQSTRPARSPATEPAPMPEMSPKAEVTSPLTPNAVAPTTDSKANEDQIVAKVVERMKAEQAADPKPSVAEPPKLVLQGITYAKDGSEAMINNLTVREGDDIEGVRVVTIENRRVKLDFNGHEITLRLP